MGSGGLRSDDRLNHFAQDLVAEFERHQEFKVSGVGNVRAKLRERVWQRTEDRGTNLVEVYLSRLREKLGVHADVVETVWRAGYRLRA